MIHQGFFCDEAMSLHKGRATSGFRPDPLFLHNPASRGIQSGQGACAIPHFRISGPWSTKTHSILYKFRGVQTTTSLPEHYTRVALSVWAKARLRSAHPERCNVYTQRVQFSRHAGGSVVQRHGLRSVPRALPCRIPSGTRAGPSGRWWRGRKGRSRQRMLVR